MKLDADEKELLGSVERGLIGRGVDLIENVALLDVRTFCEQAVLDDASHLRTDLGDHVCGGAARQLGSQGNFLRLDLHHTDFRGIRRGSLTGRLRLLATGQDHAAQCQEKPGRPYRIFRFDLHIQYLSCLDWARNRPLSGHKKYLMNILE